MESMLDVRNLLKNFGIFIYTRNRIGDTELMELEINELYRMKLINQDQFLKATLILQKERRTILNQKNK